MLYRLLEKKEHPIENCIAENFKNNLSLYLTRKNPINQQSNREDCNRKLRQRLMQYKSKGNNIGALLTEKQKY